MNYVNKIMFSKYKSFSSPNQHIINISSNITLFIGRNNSGKSSCIDLVECAYSDLAYFKKHSIISDFCTSFTLTQDCIDRAFDKNTSGGDIGGNYNDYGSQYVGKDILLNHSSEATNSMINRKRKLSFSSFQPNINNICGKNNWDNVAYSFLNYTNDFSFRRLGAERNIIPESESSTNSVDENGNGACNLLRRFINYSQYDEKLVENELLTELNSIMYPDSMFTAIKVQQVNYNDTLLWEVFLEEKDSGRFALSQSGSGLKTIILVLINLLLIPNTPEYKDKKIIYAFEEIENNLHPALQRKIFNYIYDYALSKNCKIFITTHSHVAINSFWGKKQTMIYHIVKNSNHSSFSEIESYIDKVKILEDLDVKASDLLQANGIIWVEGPSDRIYINQWLKILCNNKYIEGQDYQFLYYGGRLLSHYTTEQDLLELINILTTNRHAAIIIDSDRKSKTSTINSTKNRIKNEFKKYGYFCWITSGKEIENYLPCDAINKAFNKNIGAIDQFELFPDYIKSIDKSFSSHKVDFSNKIVPYITAENSSNILDLERQIKKLYAEIEKWNN